MTGFILPDGEPPDTRPALTLPARAGCQVEWLQNVHISELWYWASRNEWEAHIYRKRYSTRQYDRHVLFLREPKATASCSTEDLIALGLIGVYGWRTRPARQKIREVCNDLWKRT